MRRYFKPIWSCILTLSLVASLLAVAPASTGKATEQEETVTVAEPEFSKESGNYENGFNLTLTVPEGTKVYYSTDGSDPEPESESVYIKEYSSGDSINVHDRTGEANILATAENADRMNQEGNHLYQPTAGQVAKATVIRAVAVDDQGNKSKVVTKTYFVGQNLTTRHTGVPVLSLVTDPDNLMSDETGIFVEGNNENYTQHGIEWERLTDFTFFNAKGDVDLNSLVGIRVHGGYTRKYQQKSLNVYFREEYGKKNWKYELIPGTVNHDGTAKTNKYKNFVLRNGGNDANMTKLTDVFLQSLVRDRNISTQGYQPCVVYLNGEYWGMYNIMEKYSDNWLEEEFGVNKNNVVLIKDGEVDEGEEEDIALFEEFKALGNLDMTKEENYQKFLEAVDLTSYLDYYATEIIIGNHDWGLIKNNQFWRSRTKTDAKYEDGKWRWLLHDTEFSMGLWGNDPNLIKDMISSSDEEKKDPVFAAVSKNTKFRQALASTILELLENNFSYNKNVSSYDALVELYKPQVMESLLRFGSDWGKGSEESCFDNRVDGFKNTWSSKETTVLSILKSSFGYNSNDRAQVTFTGDNGVDSLTVNKVVKTLTDGKNVSTYYKKDPIEVTAPDVEGCQFSGWEVTGGTLENASAKTTNVTLTDATVTIKAKYEKVESGKKPDQKEPGEQVSNTGKGTTTVIGNNNGTSGKTSGLAVSVKKPGKAKLISVKAGKKSMKVKIKKQASADGYQIVYATNKKFTKAKKTKITNKSTITIKKLKRKKAYYVKVRAYKKDGGKKVYGSYSKLKKVKTK